MDKSSVRWPFILVIWRSTNNRSSKFTPIFTDNVVTEVTNFISVIERWKCCTSNTDIESTTNVEVDNFTPSLVALTIKNRRFVVRICLSFITRTSNSEETNSITDINNSKISLTFLSTLSKSDNCLLYTSPSPRDRG